LSRMNGNTERSFHLQIVIDIYLYLCKLAINITCFNFIFIIINKLIFLTLITGLKLINHSNELGRRRGEHTEAEAFVWRFQWFIDIDFRLFLGLRQGLEC